MQSDSNLRETLRSIDHKSYPAYKSLRGSYRFADYVLSIDHVQGDPFAAPSHVRVTVDAKAAGSKLETGPLRNNPQLENIQIELSERDLI